LSVCARRFNGLSQCCVLLLLRHALRPVAVLLHELLAALRQQLLLLHGSLTSNKVVQLVKDAQ
jgi:hypothetical protein